MNIIKAKEEYNYLLGRYNNASNWFDRSDISYKEKENQLKNFQEILDGLNYYLAKIEVFTNQEILGGFHE